jgi:methylmalonyl-CoA mutase cobalamin-binding domain/chain
MIKTIRDAVLDYNLDAAVDAIKAAIEDKMPPTDIIENALAPSIREIGDKFGRMEVYLPELVLAADIMNACTAMLMPLLAKEGKESRAPVIVAAVQGDIHDIGKNIVASMLIASGFNVIDMGVDVKTSDLVEKTIESKAKIICASALMSSTIGSQKDIIDFLTALGERDKHVVLVGGGPTSKEWADKIGADGWGPDATSAVRLVEEHSGVRGG